MIKDTIPRTHSSLSERGMPETSYFNVIFSDNSEISEKEANWSSFSERKEVSCFGLKKFVRVSKFPVKRIEAFHEGLHSAIEVPEGCEAYQGLRSETLIVPNAERMDKVIGRIIGIMKDGEVVEEHFLDSQQYLVSGLKK